MIRMDGGSEGGHFGGGQDDGLPVVMAVQRGEPREPLFKLVKINCSLHVVSLLMQYSSAAYCGSEASKMITVGSQHGLEVSNIGLALDLFSIPTRGPSCNTYPTPPSPSGLNLAALKKSCHTRFFCFKFKSGEESNKRGATTVRDATRKNKSTSVWDLRCPKACCRISVVNHSGSDVHQQ